MSTPQTQIKHDLAQNFQKLREESPSHQRNLGIARIVSVDYTAAEATLQVLTGEDDLFQHTAVPITAPAAGARHFLGSLPEPGDICVVGWLGSNTPVILSYLNISQKAGQEWLSVQDTIPSEIDFSPKLRNQYEGIYSRRRFKAWPLSPGNVLLSSSQGADIRIDEGITIQSRKLAEIRLRDADTSTLIRSKLLHSSLSGASLSIGTVSRTAKLLPSRLQSSGIYTPHPAFQKSNPSSPFPNSGLEVDPNLDPYSLSPLISIDASISALPNLELSNTPLSTSPYSEHRLELSHTHNNSIPSSQIIDGFSPTPEPYIEIAYGTIIPNDPNDPNYGTPVSLSISPSPSSSPHPQGDAALFKITPPEDPSIPPSCVAWDKQGRLKAYVSGPQNSNSIELNTRGHTSITTPALTINTPALSLPALSLSPESSSLESNSIQLKSQTTTLQSSKSTLITSRDSISIQDANTISVSPKQTLRLISDKITLQSNTIDRTIQGKDSTLFIGPKSSLPSNGPSRTTTFASTPATGNLGGTTDKYHCLYGNREETFDLGNHSTSITIGNLTYKTGIGTFLAQAGTNSLSLSSSTGMSASTTSTTITSSTSASISSISSLSLRSAGPSKLAGSSVTLSAPGNSGLILCSSDKDPLSNLPFSFYGLGSPGHILSSI